MKLIDIHSHIHFQDFDKDRELVLERAKRVGIIAIITSTLRYSEIPKALHIVEKHPNFVFLSIGLDPKVFDPMEVKNVMKIAEQFKDRLVAIGEVGLDFISVRSNILREVQRQNLIMWIKLAIKLDLPLIIHSRHAGKKVVNILLRLGYPKVILHAFDGNVEDARKAKELGAYFSIPPSITYSKQKQQLVEKIDLERILLESDAPLLSPIKCLRNEPSNIVKTVERIAKIKEISVSEVARITTQNARTLFKLNLPLS